MISFRIGKRFVVVLVAIICFFAAPSGWTQSKQTEDNTLATSIKQKLEKWIGQKAPSFNLDLLDGGTIHSDTLKRSAYLLYFWYSGCPPCLKTSPYLPVLQEDYSDYGFTLVAVNADHFLELETTDDEISDYVKKQKYNFPIAHLDKELNDAYGQIEVFPTFFFVNEEGIINTVRFGFQSRQVLTGDIKELIRTKEKGRK
jgi:thiol-disulfide isomerase/thioredoxin